MGVRELQDAVIDAYRTFAKEHDLAGFSMDFVYWLPCMATDHGHGAGADSLYAQFDGFRRIVGEVAQLGSRWLEGLIGSQHILPWGLGPMTHPHPVLGDNQPQWLPAWPDLSLHRTAANFQRRTAWIMRNMAFLPSWKVPGLVSHQASRRFYPPSERGWDWDGARFNLLSAIASGPSSIVLGFLPAWDADEWQGMRERDGEFFRRWIEFAKDNAQVLARLEDLFDEPAPGAIDGTMALSGDGARGFVFLCNPDYETRTVAVPLPEGSVLRELHPRHGRLWRPARVSADPKEVTVLEVVPAGEVALPAIFGLAGSLTEASGVPGTSAAVEVVGEDGSVRDAVVVFDGDGVQPTLGPWALSGTAMDDIGVDLTSLRGAFSVRTRWAPGTALPGLLAQLAPPVRPVGHELLQPWSDPSRLRLHVEIIDPQAATVRARVDGREVPVRACYVGAYEHVKDTDFAVMENNLMGWYLDLHDRLLVTPDLDQPWTIELDITLEGDARFLGLHIAQRLHRSVRARQ
jgi:hypothetical protein